MKMVTNISSHQHFAMLLYLVPILLASSSLTLMASIADWICFCPRGIPGALIKYLMTNEMKSKRIWSIIPPKIFKNQVSLAIQGCGIITLRILPTHLEISYESEADKTDSETGDSKEDKLTKKYVKWHVYKSRRE